MNMHMIKAAMMNLLLLLVAAPMLLAKGPNDTEEKESPFPKTGLRFVICSSGNVELPSPLYVKVGKDYQPVTISRRMPSPRVTTEGGMVKFYAENPAQAGAVGKQVKIEPVLTINVPDAYCVPTLKALCLLQISSNSSEPPTTYFLKETDFKIGGVHVINLTPNKLEIITDPSGNFDGAEKRAFIEPAENTKNISGKAPYVWSYDGKGKADHQRVNFVLQAMPSEKRKEPLRIRSSVFMVSKDLSQINVVMQDPNRNNVYMLQSVQYGSNR